MAADTTSENSTSGPGSKSKTKKLTKKDSGAGHQGHHHYIDKQLVGSVEGDTVKLSCNADAIPKQEQSRQKTH